MKLEDLSQEQREKLAEFGVNSWFVMELLENYLNNPNSVGQDWQNLFSSLNIVTNGKFTIKADTKNGTNNQQTGTYVNFTPQSPAAQKTLNLPQPQAGEEAIQIKVLARGS